MVEAGSDFIAGAGFGMSIAPGPEALLGKDSAPNKRMQATRLRRDESDGDCRPCCEYAEESLTEVPRRTEGFR